MEENSIIIKGQNRFGEQKWGFFATKGFILSANIVHKRKKEIFRRQETLIWANLWKNDFKIIQEFRGYFHSIITSHPPTFIKILPVPKISETVSY